MRSQRWCTCYQRKGGGGGETCRQTDTETEIQTEREGGRQTVGRAYRQTDKERPCFAQNTIVS